MRTSRAGLVVSPIVVLAIVVLGCRSTSNVSSQEAGPNGDSEAGVFDVAVDLGSDGGVDGSAGWIPVPGLPANCGVRMATRPATDPGPLLWENCSTLAACRRSVAKWSAFPDGTTFLFRDDTVQWIGGRPLLQYNRWIPSAERPSQFPSGVINIVEPMEQPPLFALGQLSRLDTEPSNACGSATAAGEFGVVSKVNWAASPASFYLAFDWDKVSLGQLPVIRVLLPKELGVGGFMSHAVARDQVYVETLDPLRVFAMPAAVLSPPPTIPAQEASGLKVWNEGAFALSSATLTYIDKSGVKALLKAPVGRQFTAMAVDRLRGVLYWTDSNADAIGLTEMDLYASPLVVPLALAPRKLATLRDETARGGAGGFVAHDGVVLHLENAQRYVITQSSTGIQQKVEIPKTSFQLGQPLWVDAKEVWLVATDPGIPSPAVYPRYVVRLGR